jgi:hypothetical protein
MAADGTAKRSRTPSAAERRVMSALGQNRTVRCASRHVRFVPITDLRSCWNVEGLDEIARIEDQLLPDIIA